MAGINNPYSINLESKITDGGKRFITQNEISSFMQPIELTVTEEQVKGFLRNDFEDFMDDSQSPDPTNGVLNYVCFAAIAQEKATFWNRFHPTEPVRKYFTDVVKVTAGIIYSIQDLVSSNPFIDKRKAIDTHYQSLVEMVGLHNGGIALDLKDVPISPKEIGTINECLRRQIFVANILFDPQKREGEFRNRIWGNGFDAYINPLLSP